MECATVVLDVVSESVVWVEGVGINVEGVVEDSQNLEYSSLILRREISFGWNRSLKNSWIWSSDLVELCLLGGATGVDMWFSDVMELIFCSVDWNRREIAEGSWPRAMSRLKNFFVIELKC